MQIERFLGQVGLCRVDGKCFVTRKGEGLGSMLFGLVRKLGEEVVECL